MLDTSDRKHIDTIARKVVREETADMRVELNRIGVLLEDMDSTIATMLELLVINLDIKTQVEDHEPRISKLETNQAMFSSTLRSHSRQLKAR